MRELLDYCHIESVAQGSDPFKDHPPVGQSVYLLRGELEVVYEDDNRVLIRSGSEWARHPIGKRQPNIRSAQALSNVQLLRVDDDLLDRMVTWDQFAYHDDGKAMALKDGSESAVKRLLNSGMFSAENLSNSPFAHLPSANIGKLLNCIEAIAVWDKDVIIREGEEGDYYYLIESGRAQVTRLVGGANLVLAEIKAGDVFGEEALISDSKRNATVTMKSNGVLLRLKKQDFLELMQEPLLHRISYQDAKKKVAAGCGLAGCAPSAGIPLRQIAGCDQRAAQRHPQCHWRIEQGDDLYCVLPERPSQRGRRFHSGAGRIRCVRFGKWFVVCAQGAATIAVERLRRRKHGKSGAKQC